MGQIGDDTLQRYDEIVIAARKIVEKKNREYGSSYRENLGFEGVLLRMMDKLGRVRNLTKYKIESTEETVEDNLLDVLNYAALALICYRHERPGPRTPPAVPTKAPKGYPQAYASSPSGASRR